MKLVKQYFEILEQEIPVRKLDDYSGEHFIEEYIQNMYKHIERCGRVCYKSEDKITEGSAERFVKGLIKTHHHSVLEHGAVYLKFPNEINKKYGTCSLNSDYLKYEKNQYSKCVREATDEYSYVSTNYRIIIENSWEEDLQFLCEPTKHHEKRYTVLLHSCIHAYKDLTRHRKASFSIESTRYCKYSNIDKFGEMKFVLPPWLNLPIGSYKFNIFYSEDNWEWLLDNKAIYVDNIDHNFLTHLSLTESNYNALINYKWQPQQAAEILPQCTAADVVMSAYSSDWEFIFLLRSKIARTGAPHPLVEELMTPLMEEFKQKGYISKEFPN